MTTQKYQPNKENMGKRKLFEDHEDTCEEEACAEGDLFDETSDGVKSTDGKRTKVATEAADSEIDVMLSQYFEASGEKVTSSASSESSSIEFLVQLSQREDKLNNKVSPSIMAKATESPIINKVWLVFSAFVSAIVAIM